MKEVHMLSLIMKLYEVQSSVIVSNMFEDEALAWLTTGNGFKLGRLIPLLT